MKWILGIPVVPALIVGGEANIGLGVAVYVGFAAVLAAAASSRPERRPLHGVPDDDDPPKPKANKPTTPVTDTPARIKRLETVCIILVVVVVCSVGVGWWMLADMIEKHERRDRKSVV